MGVVIHHLPALPVAAEVKTATRWTQLTEAFLQLREGDSLQATGSECGGGVAEVVETRHRQADAAD